MVVYFDSSALVKLLLGEQHSDLAHGLWNDCDSVVASPLAFVEVHAALAAARRSRRLGHGTYQRLVDDWEDAWPAVRVVRLTDDLATDAGRLAAAHGLTGADAVHLASALAVGRDHVVLFAFDQRLHAAARAAGLATVPAAL
ncbi:MAG: type II toxin-antitoxin system VapC family toxin [Actinomycetes bacterium]